MSKMIREVININHRLRQSSLNRRLMLVKQRSSNIISIQFIICTRKANRLLFFHLK